MAKFYVTEVSKKYYENYDKDCEIKRELNVTEIENGIIIPAKEIPCRNDFAYIGGVLDSDGEFVKESSTYRDKPEKALLDGYEINEQPRYIDETVIYGGVLYEFYGHVLLETMARLWYYYKSNPNKYRVVFNVVPRARGKFKEFFELLDIPYDDNTFITEPTQYKKVVIPEQASIYAESWHKDYLIPFDYMASKVEAEKYEKVYFTRTKLVERNPVLGEKPIEKLFEKNGFKVFSPEKLPLRKQIAIMKGCKELATVASSTYHNLLFAKNGTKLICLNRAFEPDFSQHIVDLSKELDYIYIDVACNPLPVGHVLGPWIIGLTDNLINFAKDNNFKLPKKYKTNTITQEQLKYFYRFWHTANNDKIFTIEEWETAAKNTKVKFKRNFIQNICRILSYLTAGKLKNRLTYISRGGCL